MRLPVKIIYRACKNPGKHNHGFADSTALPLLVFGSVITLVIIILCIARGAYMLSGSRQPALLNDLAVSGACCSRPAFCDSLYRQGFTANQFAYRPAGHQGRYQDRGQWASSGAVAVQYQVNPEKCGKPVTSWKSRKNRLKARLRYLVRAEVPRKTLDDLFLPGRYFGSCPGLIAKSWTTTAL